MTEPTIGDILGSLLADWSMTVEPQPTVSDLEAQAIAAQHLARCLADISDIGLDQAWDCLTYVPDPQLVLLHSPQGWCALASTVATDTGLPDPKFFPTVH